ncbi:MAG TPA: molecular chaperone DnaJ [Actinomycetota bacterium]|nr:molecular chaperone DnaJ [Actinomycetota bacterium]
MPDYYEVLGISPQATPDEIKRAYRRLARELHPDANRDDPGAADKFKEVTRAYEVLSDPQKRQRYDAFGDERIDAGAFADFGGISDLFASFFGGSTRRRGPTRGADILAEVQVSLAEAAAGIEREVELETLIECSQCGGTGSAEGTFPVRCSDCGGTGEMREVRRSVFGSVMTATTCARCGGSGQEVVDPCRSCGGRGRVRSVETLNVRVPAGIEDGTQLRVTGRGEAGMRGGRAGDLYVVVRVQAHEVFRRAGADLGCEVAVPMTIAALGGHVDVPTLDGDEPLEVPAGTQSGEVVRLKGRGMPRLDGRGRGDLVVLLKVETPGELDAEQAELLERLAALRNEHIAPRTEGFFDRIKQAFS